MGFDQVFKGRNMYDNSEQDEGRYGDDANVNLKKLFCKFENINQGIFIAVTRKDFIKNRKSTNYRGRKFTCQPLKSVLNHLQCF
jgi:hypothetical protein